METLTTIPGRSHPLSDPAAVPSRRFLRSAASLCLVAVALAACHGNRAQQLRDERRAALSIQFSPNGEPLSGGPLGRPKCEDALSAWFERIDTNHDGVVGRDEFLADAARQFDRMDRYHAGYVTSLDLSEFRAPYEDSPASDAVPPASGARDEAADGRRPGGATRGGERDEAARESQQRGPIVDTRADPVMSADKTLSFKVTLEDFMAQANDVFNGLDRNHDGKVLREAVTARCTPPKK